MQPMPTTKKSHATAAIILTTPLSSKKEWCCNKGQKEAT
jgi:hypothetical protein